MSQNNINNSAVNYKYTRFSHRQERIFEEEVEGLPQKEKKYDAIYIKKKAFSRIFKTHRNIILIEEGEKDTSFFKKNIWAEDQLVLVIKTNKKTNTYTNSLEVVLCPYCWPHFDRYDDPLRGHMEHLKNSEKCLLRFCITSLQLV